VKVSIDLDLCQSHAVCMDEAPEVFRVDDDGTVRVLQEEPPEALRRAVEDAQRYCPTAAIQIA
jgi:ferredoxin